MPKTGGGNAGFDFTKIAADGSALPVNATVWACVLDNTTQLMWEVKTDDGGLSDKDHTYTWYSSDGSINGGNPGSIGNTTSCANGTTYPNCNTEAFAAAVNAAGLCGHHDWRLPTLLELASILDYSKPYPVPTIDTVYFPNTVALKFWSSSPYAKSSIIAWNIHFDYGYDGYNYKSFGWSVRLVRGGQ